MLQRGLMICLFLFAGWLSAAVARADQDLQAQLQLVRQTEGQYAISAVSLLMELGELAASEGRHGESIEMLKEAQHILHRHHGVNTLTQLEVVAQMARSYLELADVEAADNLMRFRLTVQRANFGAHDLRTVPTMLELAGWHQARARFDDARALYREALALLQAADAGGRPLQRTLNLLSFTDYLQGRCCDVALVEAAVAAAHADESLDFAERARALRGAADTLIMAGHPDRAAELYAAAGEQDSSATMPVWLGPSGGQDLIRAYEPLTNRVSQRAPRPNARQPPPGQLIGAPLAFCAAQLDRLVRHRIDFSGIEIDLAFTVDESGRPRQIRVVESNAPEVVDFLATRVLRASLFRPALAEGEVLAMPMQLTQRFGEAVSLSGDSPFPPAHTAVFQACRSLALQ